MDGGVQELEQSSTIFPGYNLDPKWIAGPYEMMALQGVGLVVSALKSPFIEGL